MNRHPKNKTTKAENTKLYSLLIPLSTFVLRKVNVNETKTRSRRVILLLLLLSTLFWAAGCEDYHSSSTGHNGPGPYYGGGSVDVADRDRPYYRGPGYWNGRVYYVWEPGHWAWRTGVVPPGTLGSNLPNNGQLLWIHGNYIAQGH